jgi:hypothetical protein
MPYTASKVDAIAALHRVSAIASPRSMISSCSMINPLHVNSQENVMAELGLCSGFSFARGRHGPASKPFVAPGCPSTSAILMFYRADFRRNRQWARISG